MLINPAFNSAYASVGGYANQSMNPYMMGGGHQQAADMMVGYNTMTQAVNPSGVIAASSYTAAQAMPVDDKKQRHGQQKYVPPKDVILKSVGI